MPYPRSGTLVMEYIVRAERQMERLLRWGRFAIIVPNPSYTGSSTIEMLARSAREIASP